MSFQNFIFWNRWDINTKRNINYRSLAPIISLLGVEHTPECQLWAAWAVANLTLFDEDKYCPLVEEEGGLAAITRIMEAILRESLTSSTSSKISGRLLELGQKATHNINEHKKKMSMIEKCGNTLVLMEVHIQLFFTFKIHVWLFRSTTLITSFKEGTKMGQVKIYVLKNIGHHLENYLCVA